MNQNQMNSTKDTNIHWGEEYVRELLSTNRHQRRMEDNLFLAVYMKNLKMIEFFLNDGARVTQEAILIAMHFKPNYKIILDLLLLYAPEDLKRDSTELLLRALVEDNFETNIELLVKSGFNFDGCALGKSPLTRAIDEKDYELIDLLLFYGANPCQQYLHKGVWISSFNYALSLPPSCAENIFKYAALHVEYRDRKLFYDNFDYFGFRAYLKFAQNCVLEIRHLKQFYIDSEKRNLYDFLVSQGTSLKFLLSNREKVDLVFHYLATAPIVIYKIPLLKKLSRKDLLNNFIQVSHLRCILANCGNSVLDSDCILYLCKFLSKKDLISFCVAISGKTI